MARKSDGSMEILEVDNVGKRDENSVDDRRELLPQVIADLERLSHSSQPSKKLLVLDLNGLLAHTFSKRERVTIPSSRDPNGVFHKKLVFKRPYCDEFLQFCFERFEVGIWSSAQKKNVEAAVNCVTGGLQKRLMFIWNQSDCTSDSRFRTVENKHKPLFLKELKKLWDGRNSAGLPWSLGRFSSSNTLLIDDSPYKALLNPPNTAIFPKPYTVEDEDDASLGPDGELRTFLEGLAAADDVPSYVAAHPIGQGAITSADSHWSYYSAIICDLSSSG